MSERMERYRSRQSRSELRGDLFYLHVVLATFTLGLVVNGCLRVPAPVGWLSLGGGAVLGLVQVGLFRCLAWSRWVAVALLTVASLALAARIVLRHEAATSAWHLVIFAVFAAYLAQPQTGALFRAGRRSLEE